MSKQERESGIELLRVICILLIIAHHYVLHGDYPEISVMTFSWQNFFLQIVCGGGPWLVMCLSLSRAST